MPVLGFIGTGNMGGALARAAAKSGSELMLANRHPEKAQKLIDEIGGKLCSNIEVAQQADFVFLGVKPQMIEGVMEELEPALARRRDRFFIVTMLGGTSIERIRSLAGGDYAVIRIMPNTPAAIGEGTILYCCSEDVKPEEEQVFLNSMAAAGKFIKLDEKLMDAGSSVSGCGPAFLDMFIEAMADGGVACGLPRAKAMELACQMVIGSAKLILESGKHPGQLKDEVCSPGGTTIQGVRKLEEGGFRAAVMNAVIAAYEKNSSLG